MVMILEKQLNTLIRDMHAIQKEVILAKTRRLKPSKRRLDQWNALAEKVSAKWDAVSAVDEISAQREKSW